VHKINEIQTKDSQRTFGTFASSNAQPKTLACKRAKFLPTLKLTTNEGNN